MGGQLASRAPGKTSGVTAEDFVAAPNTGALIPGKRNLVQSVFIGDQWIDHGAKCDGKDRTTSGCFLEDGQRMRLLIRLEGHVLNAAGNYKSALEQLRVDELMKKDDDLSWVLSIALDVVGAHFLTVTARALKGVKAAGVRTLEDITVEAGTRGAYDANAWTSRAENMLHSVSDRSIESYTKVGIDAAKKKGVKEVQRQTNASNRDEKTEALAYIVQLQNACDIGFERFLANATGNTNDAELVVLYEGMKPENHSVEAYKAALGEKLSRFKKSGVNQIGRKATSDRFSHEITVYRDTRLVWLKDLNGNKTLWYQSQEGNIDPDVVYPGDPGSKPFYPDDNTPQVFGPHDPRESAQLDRRVPEEFQEAALARSEATWGPTPTIEDPYAVWFRHSAFDPSKASNANRPVPSAALVASNTPPFSAALPSTPLPFLQLSNLPSKSPPSMGGAPKGSTP